MTCCLRHCRVTVSVCLLECDTSRSGSPPTRGLFSCFLVEGSRLSSPLTGRVEILNHQKKLTGLSIPPTQPNQSTNCHTTRPNTSHTSRYHQILSTISATLIRSITISRQITCYSPSTGAVVGTRDSACCTGQSRHPHRG